MLKPQPSITPPPLFSRPPSSVQKLIDDLKSAQHAGVQPKKTRAQYGVGQIATMNLPEGWSIANQVQNVLGNSCYCEVRPEFNFDGRLEFYYRGVRVPPNEGAVFNSMLSVGGHELDEAELKLLGSILRGKENASMFKTDLAWTAVLNGKSVLMIEGTYVEDGLRTLVVLIDSDGTGTVIQELAYTAPPCFYQQFRPQIDDAIRSIKWR